MGGRAGGKRGAGRGGRQSGARGATYPVAVDDGRGRDRRSVGAGPRRRAIGSGGGLYRRLRRASSRPRWRCRVVRGGRTTRPHPIQLHRRVRTASGLLGMHQPRVCREGKGARTRVTMRKGYRREGGRCDGGRRDGDGKEYGIPVSLTTLLSPPRSPSPAALTYHDRTRACRA